MKDLIIVHSDEYENWIFDPDHPTQGRRFTKAYDLTLTMAEAEGLTVETIDPALASIAGLQRVHTRRYIDEVVTEHKSGEWIGQRPDLSRLALLFAGGTMRALTALLDNETLTAAHFPGAKHHAQADESSGFCVFADFALAAMAAQDCGLRVAILDIDAHHGDGTEKLTYNEEYILTYSIHQHGIFPGTGVTDDPAANVYNWPLGNRDGDRSLMQGVRDFLTVAGGFKPNLIMIAGGADGHKTDPLSGLRYSISGFRSVAQAVRREYPVTPILFGGAGGYTPDGATPLAWATMVTELAR